MSVVVRMYLGLPIWVPSLEVEAGMAVNEPTSYAVKAHHGSGLELVKQGEQKGFWKSSEKTMAIRL